MTLCPIAIAVGCKKCPIFAVCPVKGIIGDYIPGVAEDKKPQTRPKKSGWQEVAIGRRDRVRRRHLARGSRTQAPGQVLRTERAVRWPSSTRSGRFGALAYYERVTRWRARSES
jgi:hypothetical protein